MYIVERCENMPMVWVAHDEQRSGKGREVYGASQEAMMAPSCEHCEKGAVAPRVGWR
jgi:hypothetical protein